jgi:hypothetical protein
MGIPPTEIPEVHPLVVVATRENFVQEAEPGSGGELMRDITDVFSIVETAEKVRKLKKKDYFLCAGFSS